MAASLVAPPLCAQSAEQNKATARDAARAGIEAYNVREYEKAADLLQRAEKLYHAPTHVLYLARAQLQLGMLVEARENYILLTREELSDKTSEAFRRAAEAAREELAALEPRVPVVTIRVEGDPEGKATVTMDGKPLPPAMIGIPTRANPGKHMVKAELAGHRAEVAELTLAEGEQGAVTLKLQATGEADRNAVASRSNGQQGDNAERDPTSNGKRVTAFSALGVGAIALGLGTWAGLRNGSKRSDADSAFDACAPDCTGSERGNVESLDKEATSAGNLAIVGFSVGVVGVATGIVLFSLKPKRSSARIQPWVTTESVGVLGRF